MAVTSRKTFKCHIQPTNVFSPEDSPILPNLSKQCNSLHDQNGLTLFFFLVLLHVGDLAPNLTVQSDVVAGSNPDRVVLLMEYQQV